MSDRIGTSCVIVGAAILLGVLSGGTANASDWLHWRGPSQNGTSSETDLPERFTPGGDGERWSIELAGRGTPVVAGGQLYAMGYDGEKGDLLEHVICVDVDSGRVVWDHVFKDFITDTIYDRYAIGSPTVDAQSGHVYVMSSAGELTAFTADGRMTWQRSMMSEFGRLSFPNGRTGAPIIDGDRVIIHIISVNWGPVNGPARDRFFAFDKWTGELIWVSTPGTGPKDSSFSAPLLLDDPNGRRVLVAGTGCGHVVGVDARTGEALWRFPFATGGVNSAVVLHGDTLVAIHGKENLDSSSIGRMAGLDLVKINAAVAAAHSDGKTVVLDPPAIELWRADLAAFTSSPTLVGDRVFQTVANGELVAIDASTGATAWHERLGSDQIHASPVYGDGKLYVPMNDGSFWVLRPGVDAPEVVQTVQLEGSCLGAPAIADGNVFVHTTKRLYCFGPKPEFIPGPGSFTRLQIVPAEVVVTPGSRTPIRVRGLRADGRVAEARVRDLTWSARGGVSLDFSEEGVLQVAADSRPGIAFVDAKAGESVGRLRVRVVLPLPFTEDFEGTKLVAPSAEDVAIGPPPSHWIGSRLKFDVREIDGSKVFAKTLENNLFQRATTLFGTRDMKDYEVRVDIKTDGNRRSMSSAGVVNQRYLIQLKGNHKQLEVSSNMERLKQSVPFRWKAGTWYTLRTRVDVAADGTGVIRAKAWPRHDPEPVDWTIEVDHPHAHRHGSPGLYGFSPQSRFRVYMDNLKVTPHD